MSWVCAFLLAAFWIAMLVYGSAAAARGLVRVRREARAHGLACDLLARTMHGTIGAAAGTGGYRGAASSPGAIDVRIVAGGAGEGPLAWWEVTATRRQPLALGLALPSIGSEGLESELRYLRPRELRAAMAPAEPALHAAAALGLESVDDRRIVLHTRGRDLDRLWEALDAVHELARALSALEPPPSGASE